MKRTILLTITLILALTFGNIVYSISFGNRLGRTATIKACKKQKKKCLKRARNFIAKAACKEAYKKCKKKCKKKFR